MWANLHTSLAELACVFDYSPRSPSYTDPFTSTHDNVLIHNYNLPIFFRYDQLVKLMLTSLISVKITKFSPLTGRRIMFIGREKTESDPKDSC